MGTEGERLWTFEVVIERPNVMESLGLQLAPLMRCVQVAEGEEAGLVARANCLTPAERHVRLYDIITEVNGHTERRAVLHELNGAAAVRIKVARPEEITVSF